MFFLGAGFMLIETKAVVRMALLFGSTWIVISIVFAAVLVLIAGIVFVVQFAKAAELDRAFGANIAGAVLGGLAEYSSMRLGFQSVGFVAIGFYLLAMLALRRQREGELGWSPRPELATFEN